MIIIIIANLILQGSVLPFFGFLIFFPNPALASLVVISIFKGRYYGAFFGLFMGLAQDILFGDIMGVYALIYFLIGYWIGMMNDSLNTENIIIHVVFTMISTIAYNSMYFLVMYFLSKDISLLDAMTRTFSVEILYNSILAIIIYKVFHKIFGVSSLKFRKRQRG